MTSLVKNAMVGTEGGNLPTRKWAIGLGFACPRGRSSAFRLAAVERPNQVELLAFDVRQAIKTRAARSDFFAGV